MNVWVRQFAIATVLAGLAAPALAESLAKKYEKLYGMGSSTTKHAACQTDPLHTMSSYIKNSVMDDLHKKPELYKDRATIDFQRVPGDLHFEKIAGVYKSNKPTTEYLLPDTREEYRGSTIACRLACAWLIAPKCVVMTENGKEMLAYWDRGGSLKYVLKADFDVVGE